MDQDSIESRLEAAKAKYPGRRLYVVTDTPAGDLILGKPRRQEYEAYLSLLLSDEKEEKAKGPATILLACAADPDPKAMRDLLDEYPALATFPAVAQACRVCTGQAKADTEKK